MRYVCTLLISFAVVYPTYANAQSCTAGQIDALKSQHYSRDLRTYKNVDRRSVCNRSASASFSTFTNSVGSMAGIGSSKSSSSGFLGFRKDCGNSTAVSTADINQVQTAEYLPPEVIQQLPTICGGGLVADVRVVRTVDGGARVTVYGAFFPMSEIKTVKPVRVSIKQDETQTKDFGYYNPFAPSLANQHTELADFLIKDIRRGATATVTVVQRGVVANQELTATVDLPAETRIPKNWKPERRKDGYWDCVRGDIVEGVVPATPGGNPIGACRISFGVVEIIQADMNIRAGRFVWKGVLGKQVTTVECMRSPPTGGGAGTAAVPIKAFNNWEGDGARVAELCAAADNTADLVGGFY